MRTAPPAVDHDAAPSIATHALAAATRLHWPVLALLLTAALLLGGSSRGAPGDVLVHLLALAMLAVLCIGAQIRWPEARPTRAIAALWLLALALPLLHGLPLPPGLWMRLPGRAEVAQALALAGQPLGWMPLSLNPDGARAAFLHLLIGLAAYLGTRTLTDRAARWRVPGLLLALAVLSVVLGLAQFADGPNSPLRFHVMFPTPDAIGFFANRNHQALWLAACFPLATVWTLGWLRGAHHSPANQALGLTAGIGLGAVLLLGLALTRSRAGVVLGMLALFGSLALVLSSRRGPHRGARWIGLSGLAGLVLAVQFGLYGLMQRFEADPLDDARFTLAAVAVQAARHYAPAGSGLGSFVPAYAGFEERETTFPSFANHAHNEYVEVWLEAGWPGLALLAAGLALWLWLGLRIWRPAEEAPRREALLAQAAWLSLSLLLLHSLVDYPLRSPALMAFAGSLLALVVLGLPNGRTIPTPA